ncbi:MAG: hypothetical protein Q4A67_02155 [Aerococcus sp.]|nr:hypothetical protein [Aerococcus sp.]
MNKTEEELLAEARQEFTERMLSQRSPQTEEEKRIARQRNKKLDKMIKAEMKRQGYDLKELGIENW